MNEYPDWCPTCSSQWVIFTGDQYHAEGECPTCGPVDINPDLIAAERAQDKADEWAMDAARDARLER